MTLAIPLYFDPQTEAAIQAIWQELAREKIAPYMASAGIRPHITLAIYRDIDKQACQKLLTPLVSGLDPLPITLSYLGVFPAPAPVVFLAPTITGQLLHLHEQVNQQLDAVAHQPDPFYLPGHWVPHCTLAVEFEAEHIMRAVEIILRASLPLRGWASEVCLVEFPVIDQVFSLPVRSWKEQLP